MTVSLPMLTCLTTLTVVGVVSPVGDEIDIENFKCSVVSPYSIECWNTGKVCEEYHRIDKEWSRKINGCAIEGNKNYPCPPDEDRPRELRYGFPEYLGSYCSTYVFGTDYPGLSRTDRGNTKP